MKSLQTFYFIFLFNTIVCAQQKAIVTGKIIDSNNNPISNVTIRLIGNNYQTTSDAKGNYSLFLENKNTEIEFTHIGYKSQTISIANKEIKNDTIFLNITIQELIANLPEVNIATERKKTERVFAKTSTLIYDFQFWNNDKIVLLVAAENKNKIKLIDSKDSVLSELKLPCAMNEIFEDCYGNLHLLSNDSSYQIDINEKNALKLYTAFSINIFNALLKNIVASTNQILVAMSISPTKKTILYTRFDKITKEKSILKLIYDSLGEDNLMNNIERTDAIFKAMQTGQVNFLKPEDRSIIDKKGTGLDVDWTNLRLASLASTYNIFDKETYSPLFYINDTIFIFDHIQDKINKYNAEGLLLNTVSIKYHHHKYWKHKLFRDYEHKRAFAKYEENGLTALNEINLNNGSLIKSTVLTNHIFIDTIKIRGNYIYYLTNGNDENDRKNLYKQIID